MPVFSRLTVLIGLCAALLVSAGPARAEAGASDWAASDQGEVRLIAASTATGTATELRLGLHFRLRDGWKIYWRSPGDAGYPPGIDWSGSENLASASIRWPAPHRFEVLGFQSMGYQGEVVLPVLATLAEAGRAASLKAKVDYLVCDKICVPQAANLTLEIPQGSPAATAMAHHIAQFDAAVPGDGAAHGLTLASPVASGDGDDARLRVTVTADPPLGTPDLFVEGPDNVQFDAPKVRRENGGRRVVLDAAVAKGTNTGSLVGKAFTVTVVDGARSIEAAAVPIPGAPAEDSAAALLGILGIALLGGLILNLMPCVLPVLSIKVLSVMGHGGGERRHVRRGFVASSAGIVVSFLALAAAAVAVKSAGAAVGWGIQFQQPVFLVAMVVILSLFAANLWGVFEIPLPYWLGGVGRGHGAPHSIGGHFASGAFATLLATPCTAPFLGTAVGFALSRGAVEIFAVFTALGIGMAIPYLLVAAWPSLALRLPRPGKWMVHVRRALGLALAGTAVWLLTVLAAQAGTGGAVAAGLAMVAAVAVLALRRRLPERVRPAAFVAVAALAALAFATPFQAVSTNVRDLPKQDVPWVNFDQTAIPRLVADGKLVFVDVTADWCITCQVNKAAVINRGEVALRLTKPDTVYMRADWTKPDDAIAAYLGSFGRYGIPFNAVYGPGAPDGLPLPELLSAEAVLTAFDAAARPN